VSATPLVKTPSSDLWACGSESDPGLPITAGRVFLRPVAAGFSNDGTVWLADLRGVAGQNSFLVEVPIPQQFLQRKRRPDSHRVQISQDPGAGIELCLRITPRVWAPRWAECQHRHAHGSNDFSRRGLLVTGSTRVDAGSVLVRGGFGRSGTRGATLGGRSRRTSCSFLLSTEVTRRNFPMTAASTPRG